MKPLLAAPVSPLLAALCLCLPYMASNLSQLEATAMIWLAGIMLALAVVLTGFFWWCVGHIGRAAVCATIAMYGLFFFPQVAMAVALPPRATDALLLAVCAFVAWMVVKARRSVSDYRIAHLVLNGVLLCILMIPLFGLVRDGIKLAPGRWMEEPLFPDLAPTLADATPAVRPGPDVWHLVLDRYAGNRTLQSLYEFDNAPFTDALRQRGFAVADNAAANYQRTAHSLASTLNFDFLDAIGKRSEIHRADLVPLYRTLTDSRIARFFKAAKYHLVQVGPWWEPTRRGRWADEHVNYHDMPDLLRLTFERSMFGWVLSRAGISDGRLDQCRRLKYQFARMDEIASSDQPKYVFAHLLLPHPPFVLTPDGRCKNPAEVAALSRRQNYIDQVQYANQHLLELIDRIIAGPRPAVILLHADEGPWPEALAGNETELGLDVTNVDWSKVTPRQLQEKMQILLAVKGVAIGDLPLAADATPVNLYRQVLNRYFGYSLPYLAERSFVFRSRRHLYEFADVTDLLR